MCWALFLTTRLMCMFSKIERLLEFCFITNTQLNLAVDNYSIVLTLDWTKLNQKINYNFKIMSENWKIMYKKNPNPSPSISSLTIPSRRSMSDSSVWLCWKTWEIVLDLTSHSNCHARSWLNKLMLKSFQMQVFLIYFSLLSLNLNLHFVLRDPSEGEASGRTDTSRWGATINPSLPGPVCANVLLKYRQHFINMSRMNH